MASRRPDPVRWLWYAVGGRLPHRYREWVLRDVTSRHYLWRHAVRTTVLVVPLASVWLLLPGPIGLRLMLCLMALLVGYFYSFAYADENCEHRLLRHGFPYGTAAAIRKARRDDEEAAVRERYLARYRS